jgi:MoxR-like ATPase
MSTKNLASDGLSKVKGLSTALNASVLGYPDQIETIICTLLAGGHVSALGEPGTAKTLTMRAVAWCFADAKYHREQLVPDTMPADLLGTNVYIKDTSAFEFRYGPLNPDVNFFHADEINRTTPKTQSALLQAMEEGQISTPNGVVSLNEVFMLLATRNPIDLEGTYPLPAAQLDRFAVELYYDRLPKELELEVLAKTSFNRHGLDPAHKGVISVKDIPAIREELNGVHCSRSIMAYVEELIHATRPEVASELHPDLKNAFRAGVSVRAGQWLLRLGRARAYMQGRNFIQPDDVKFFVPAVLRHRLYLSEDKQLNGEKPDTVIKTLMGAVKVVNQDGSKD